MKTWRLMIDGPVDGATNMARDRAVQLAVESGAVPPTLRLYGWSRPTVTLGRFQDPSGVDFDAVDRYGVDVVRRFTGGRGVLHDDEVTYALVARAADGVPRGVAASYRFLCEPLAEAYRGLGVEAQLTERDSHKPSSASCYLATTRADLSLGAAKLSGSAQVWHGTTVLQHGSFTRTRDVAREAEIFRLGEDERSRLLSETATMSDAMPVVPDEEVLIRTIVSSFERALGIELAPSGFTQLEQELERGLMPEVRVLPPPSTELT